MVVSQPIAVSKIEENSWNPNKMAPERWEALLEDMRKGGPNAIDPILVMSKRVIVPDAPKDSFIAVDGNHRLRGSRKLRWPKIHAIFDATITSEKQARMISYAKNYERGSMDPYKQAEYFKWFVDQGWTHEKIARMHRIDRSTVTKQLSLNKIEPDVKERLTNVPRVTVSHLEPISTLTPPQQRKYAKELNREYGKGDRESPSVRTIEHKVSWIKREEREAEELRKAVEKAKFPKCPTCGKSPEKHSYRNLPWVHCPSYHEWSLEAGLPKQEPLVKREKGKPQLPKYIRMTHTVDDFRRVFGEYARAQVPKIKEINDLSCWGERDHVHADLRGSIVSLSVDIGGKEFSLHAEPKSYASKALQKFKTSVSVYPEPKTKKDLVKLEELVKSIFKAVK